MTNGNRSTPFDGDRISWTRDADPMKGYVGDESEPRFEIRRDREKGGVVLTHHGRYVACAHCWWQLMRCAEASLNIYLPLAA